MVVVPGRSNYNIRGCNRWFAKGDNLFMGNPIRHEKDGKRIGVSLEDGIL